VTARVWTRRSVLALGVGAVGVVAVPGGARAAPVRVGDFTFDVPSTIGATAPYPSLGSGWQWMGRTSEPLNLPRTVVLARADLGSSDSEEILGLALASSATGVLAELEIGSSRTRSMPGGQQVRYPLSYAIRADARYHGTLLIATRDLPPAALLAVLGDDTLTANTIDTVLGSARWIT